MTDHGVESARNSVFVFAADDFIRTTSVHQSSAENLGRHTRHYVGGRRKFATVALAVWPSARYPLWTGAIVADLNDEALHFGRDSC